MAPRETKWGWEKVIPLYMPVNTSSVLQDISDVAVGGPVIQNNGINRDGGVTELYEYTNTLDPSIRTFVTSNNLVMGLNVTSGDVSTLTNTLNYTPDLVPDDLLEPDDTLFPSGSTGGYVSFGRLNGSGVQQFFLKNQIPAQYLDVVVASATAVAGVTYTLLGLRFVGSDLIAIDEFDPVTNAIYNTKTASAPAIDSQSCARFARANILTYALCVSTTGFIYSKNITGTYTIQYCLNGSTYNTAIAISAGELADCSCYWNAGRCVFTANTAAASGLYYNNAAKDNYSTWAELLSTTYSAHGIMLGDYGPYVLATANTALSLGCTTANAREPVFWVNMPAAGTAPTTATGWSAVGTYTPGAVGSATGGLFSGSASAATFHLETGVVTPYGASGIYGSGGATYNTQPFGEFHLSISKANTTATVIPKTFPQLDVQHQMVVLRSYNGSIALIAMNATAFGDAQDCGNLVNDYAGGSFGFDIMQGNPAPTLASSTMAPLYKNYFFHPFSWRGATSKTGYTVYKLNNGTFVCAYTTTEPKFEEIGTGIVAINTAGAYGAIIDLNYQQIYYSYSAYTPSFFFANTSTTDAHSVMYLKIFNQYSSSVEPGQIFGDYAYVAAMATDVSSGKCTPIGWTAWNGQNTDYIGDYYAYTLGSASGLALNAIHQGGYVANANVPPGGDAVFSSGGIQMLNASAVQTMSYYGYYLFPSTGGSNLLPWRIASVFIIHGVTYAINGEWIWQLNMTFGTAGVVQGAPVKLVYAIGMQYLCSSPEKAWFVSDFDNCLYTFDGGQSLLKFYQFNQKPAIVDAVYSVRDNALYMQTTSSILSIREESSRYEISESVDPQPLQITENTLPNVWTATSYLKSTSGGLYFLCGSSYVTRQYEQGLGQIIPLKYQTSYMSPGEWYTMRVGRVCGQIYCYGGLSGSILLSCNYLLPDGTSGVDTDVQVMNVLNAQGYYRFSWNPPHSNVLAASFGIQHTTLEQKILLMELIIYYTPDAEAIPLNEVQA